jgi:hypothetical protein
MPDDLVSILAKDQDKQKQIRDKSQNDAQASGARSIASNDQIKASGLVAAKGQAGVPMGSKSPPPPKAAPAVKAAAPGALASTKSSAGTPEGSKSPPKMVIQAIPAFKGKPSVSTGNVPTAAAAAAATPLSPTTAQKLNVNANSFRPGGAKPAAPPAPVPSASTSPSKSRAGDVRVSGNTSGKVGRWLTEISEQTSPSTTNPFFGNRPIKKGAVVNVKDDFNPFKHGKVPETNTISQYTF